MILGAVALALLALGTHPFVSYPLSLLLLRRSWRRRERTSAGPERPRPLSLLVCAHNEERWLPEKLRSIEAIVRGGADIEVLVYSDGSTDGTNEILAAAPPWVRAVVSQERLGKGHGLNRLAERASKELLVFSDANVILDPALPAALARDFADPAVGVVCGTVRRVARASFATATVTEAYYRLEQRLKRLESELDTTIMSDGSLYAVHRRLFRPIPPTIMDDAFTSTSILCDGYRLAQSAGLSGWEADEAPPGRELARKRRIACQAFRCHLFMWPRLRRLPRLRLYMYLSHKLLRWLSGFLIASGLACGLVACALAAPGSTVGVLAVGALATCFLVALRPGPARQAAAAAASFAVTALGVIDALVGRTYVPWTPVRPLSAGATEKASIV